MKTKSLAIGILSSSVDYLSSSAGPRPQIEFEASWQRSAISIEISVHGAQNWFLGRLALRFRASARPDNLNDSILETEPKRR